MSTRKGRRSTRIVWPVAVGFFDHARMLAAWCETREAFRHFRLDRMAAVAVTGRAPAQGAAHAACATGGGRRGSTSERRRLRRRPPAA